jgi:PPOX class probable F420-dependent enzyme
MSAFDAFHKKQYLNIETFRKSGEGVKTPVWFVQEGDVLYIRTGANSGKVKRLHRSTAVKVAPCTMSGKVTGEWVDAQVRLVDDAPTIEKVSTLIKKKYSLFANMFGMQTNTGNEGNVDIEIKTA